MIRALILCIGAFFAFFIPHASAEEKLPEIGAIQILTRSDWTLLVRPDGSGHLFFGAGGPYSYNFLKGTVDFRSLLETVNKAKPVKPGGRESFYAFMLPKQLAGYQAVPLSFSDSGLLTPFFSAVVSGVRTQKEPVNTSTQGFEKLVAENPFF